MCILRLVLILNLILVCFLVIPGINAYFVQYFPNSETWFDAHNFCYNIQGRLATTEDILNCNQITRNIDSTNGSTFWTGKYKRVAHWISKIDCSNISRNLNSSQAKSASECFDVCRKQTLDQINTASNGSGNCAFIDCRDEPKFKFNCATERIPFCDWNTSHEKCKYTIPGNISHVGKPMTNWLQIHSEVFWPTVTCDGISTEEAVTECELFSFNDNHGVSSILVNTSCREKTNGFFCASSSNNMTTHRTKTNTNPAIWCSGTHIPTKLNCSSDRIINVVKITGTISTIVKQNDNRNSTAISEHHATSNIGLIVGGVSGALVLFGVVIIVVILTLRRKNASTKNQNVEQSEASNEDNQRNNRSNNIRVNQLYEDEGARADRPFPVRTKEAEITNEQEGKRPNDVYTVVMKNNKPSPLQVRLKPVVASADDVESEYDRMNITPNFLEDNMENNLYDSSIADRCESDPTYNTATNTRHSRQHTEDVYN